MSYVKRQELFKNINPLLKKYKYDGEVPPSYIPAHKRKKITSYMGRSSFNPGYYGKSLLLFANITVNVILIEPSNDREDGNKTSKMAAEGKNAQHADYNRSLSERMADGLEVKTFQNKQRIHFGRLDKEENRYRQRSENKALEPH